LNAKMKHLLLTTIAAVLLVGCCTTPSPESQTAKAPDISIHEAAMEGNIEAVKQHLDAGTDVNAKEEDGVGETPLHWAASLGHKEIVELLIAKGADVNAQSVILGTPLDLAIQFKEPETADLLRKHGVQFKQTETADLLRKHGGKTGAELKAEGK